MADITEAHDNSHCARRCCVKCGEARQQSVIGNAVSTFGEKSYLTHSAHIKYNPGIKFTPEKL